MDYMKRLMLEEATSQSSNALGSGTFNTTTGIDIPDFDFNFGGVTSSTGTTTSTSTDGGGFFSNFNLNGLLDTMLKGGMTWAQIEAAKNGKDVYVQGQAGDQKENITPILISKLEAQAAAQQTTVNQMMQVMQQQMTQNQNNNNNNPNEDNTLKYVGIGVGSLVLIGGIFMLVNNKKKSK